MLLLEGEGLGLVCLDHRRPLEYLVLSTKVNARYSVLASGGFSRELIQLWLYLGLL